MMKNKKPVGAHPVRDCPSHEASQVHLTRTVEPARALPKEVPSGQGVPVLGGGDFNA
jgi:hypothetical protein